MVFLGGAVLANLVSSIEHSIQGKTFILTIQIADKEDMWVTKQDWAEQGGRALSKLGPR